MSTQIRSFAALLILGLPFSLMAQVPANRDWHKSKLSGDSTTLIEARKYIDSNRRDANKMRSIFQAEDNALRTGKGSAVTMLKWALSAVILGQHDWQFGRDMLMEREMSVPSKYFDKFLSSYGYELTRARLLFNVNYEFPARELTSIAEKLIKINSNDIDTIYAFTYLLSPQANQGEVSRAKWVADRLAEIPKKTWYDFGRLAYIHYKFWMKSKSKSAADTALKYLSNVRKLAKYEEQRRIIDSYISEIKAKTKD